jgi:uncharacterized protein YbjT (DUF2867 family)
MKEYGVNRLVILSAFGTGESARATSLFMRKVLVAWILKIPFEDHARQEHMVRESGLQWVIARPTRLTDGPARRQYQKKIAIESVPSSISRADVADFLVEAAETDQWVNQTVHLGG